MKLIGILLTLGWVFSLWGARIEVDIKHMSCGMCVEKITQELKATTKADNVVVSLDEKKARLEERQGQSLTDQEIRQAIKKAGYVATKISRLP